MANDDEKPTCDWCGKVYNEYLGDRFWSGFFEGPNGEELDLLCDDCHRVLVRS